jgi:hypothetical protein
MKAHLLYRDQDLDLHQALPWNTDALTKDLGLDTLFGAMAASDKLVLEVVQRVVLLGLENDVERIRYRQPVLQDCLRHPAVARQLYELAGRAMEQERKHFFFGFFNSPESVLRRAIESLETFLPFLWQLRAVAQSQAGQFTSEGWCQLFAAIERELTDEYFGRIEDYLEQLKLRNGVLLSAGLGQGHKAANYILHHVEPEARRAWRWWLWFLAAWVKSLFGGRRPTRPVRRRPRQPALEFSIDPRDESGARALGELRDRGISLVANALAQSADHVHSFFEMLRTELGFYLGCVNLHEQLTRKHEPVCFPEPITAAAHELSFRSLYDVSLSLNMKSRVAGNDVIADHKELLIVTGANRGGKSTFLRSLGLAQLMMQAGLFVPAEQFHASLCDNLFTHYKREEDIGMKRGKLDEELSRMSDIVDRVTSDSIILFNESFAATNEREGSEIAHQIVSALLEKQVRIVFVTHLYEFASSFYQGGMKNALFLRVERQGEAKRNFQLREGRPLKTSFGEDLYLRIFRAKGANNGAEAQTAYAGTRDTDLGHIRPEKSSDGI